MTTCVCGCVVKNMYEHIKTRKHRRFLELKKGIEINECEHQTYCPICRVFIQNQNINIHLKTNQHKFYQKNIENDYKLLFYQCKKCGQMIRKSRREHHESVHKHGPIIKLGDNIIETEIDVF